MNFMEIFCFWSADANSAVVVAVAEGKRVILDEKEYENGIILCLVLFW